MDAFHDTLHLGVRPRRLADAQRAVEDELARRSWPVMVVRDAHLLRTEALQYVYGLWSLFQDRERRMPVVLVGPERLRSVLRWPSLASLESCIFIWYRLAPPSEGARPRRPGLVRTAPRPCSDQFNRESVAARHLPAQHVTSQRRPHRG
ncbi:hypothetical protein [Streptomyces sp. NBC_01693]|uniref:hypothetical protein n=1 Tax=Streptomyces sp. NBC_01693 TaxID=2975912 RepID=UPI003FCE8265